MIVDALNKALVFAIEGSKNNLTKLIKEESIWGESDEALKGLNYFYAVNYSYLLFLYLTRDNHTWAEAEEKFCITKVRKCLACKGISLDELLAFYGYTTSISCNGIETIEMEKSVEVEPTECGTEEVPTPIDIEELISNGNYCSWDIEDVNLPALVLGNGTNGVGLGIGMETPQEGGESGGGEVPPGEGEGRL